MSAPSVLKQRLRDIGDIVLTVQHLNEAIFLAAAGLGDVNHTNAIQAIADQIENKIGIITDRLDEVSEGLK